MKESTKNVIKYLQAHANEDLTAEMIADALGVDKKSVNGSFTMGICRKKLGFREETEVVTDEGTHEKVKFLKLNDEGLAFDVDAEPDSK